MKCWKCGHSPHKGKVCGTEVLKSFGIHGAADQFTDCDCSEYEPVKPSAMAWEEE